MKRFLSIARRTPRPTFVSIRGFATQMEPDNKDRKDIRMYLESADKSEWQTLLPLGIFHGIKTNPLLLKEAGVDLTPPVYPELRDIIRCAVDDYGLKEIFVQAWGSSTEELVRNGLAARMFDRHVVISLPFTFEGIRAAAELIEKGASVCMTTGHAQKQAIMGAALKADYYAPSVSSISSSGEDAVAQCKAMQEIVDGVQSETRVMASDLQSADEIVELSKSGIRTFSLPAKVAFELVNQPLTCKMTDEYERVSQALLESKQ